MARACRTIGRPMMANMADGGKTPILPAATLEQIGYACAIFPSATALAAAAAIKAVLRGLKQHGTSQTPEVPLFDFGEFCRLIGFEEVWAFEKRWGNARPDAA